MKIVQQILIVGCGGFLGSIARYVLALFSTSLFKSAPYPLGTTVVNMIGCLIIGLLAGFTEHNHPFSPSVRLFLFIGLLGGFTTFSSFGLETFTLLKNKHLWLASINAFGQLFVGLLAVALGYWLMQLTQSR